jgi:hypothetical protein
MRQDPTPQVLAQLALDVLRQGAHVFLPCFCEKRLKVLGDDLVERRGFEFVPLAVFGRGWRWSMARSVRSHQRTISEPCAT